MTLQANERGLNGKRPGQLVQPDRAFQNILSLELVYAGNDSWTSITLKPEHVAHAHGQ